MSTRLYTKVSQAFWRTPDGKFHPAKVENMKIWKDGPDEVYWFDKLFEGGIFLPKPLSETKRALTILLSGPPGTGKSTLALELCHRWSNTHVVIKTSEQNFQKKSKQYNSLYITSESEEEWLIQKAKSLWMDVDVNFVDGVIGSGNTENRPRVNIWKTSEIRNFLQAQHSEPNDLTLFIGCIVAIWQPNRVSSYNRIEQVIRDLWNRQLLAKGLQNFTPQILVVDSLNTAELSKRATLFKRFMSLVDAGPEIIITVIESDARNNSSSFWDYSADIVIRLDKKDEAGYLIRTLEIEKARYQSHVWGKHQLKIYARDTQNASGEKRIQDHPYRDEGGIFIYPSIHYYLSVYKHLKPKFSDLEFEAPIKGLAPIKDGEGGILKDGFPRGRCTGFIGVRGGHKSHLGYLAVLSRIIKQDTNERALIISLRDDEDMAERTLNKILKNETNYSGNLNSLKDQDKIEILYFPPGYVTPEEFFHRVFMSIQRLKSYPGDPNVIVLFNSLDQLSSRFPLCAKQQIFIPGLIATLRAENITSFFIAVEEPGQPPEQYGLLSMADALIKFTRIKISKEDYLGHIDHSLKIKENINYSETIDKISETQLVVTLRIVRFGGGRAAGAGGLLELIHSDDPKANLYSNRLYKDGHIVKTGLVFIPFSPAFKEEECIVRDWSERSKNSTSTHFAF